MRVFHAEDSSLLRLRIQREIEQIQGIELVGGAATATQAIEQARTLRPDILILDLELAEGNGLDILRAFHREESAPVSIILSNHADPVSRSRCLRAGAAYFFDKSVDFDKFISVMRELGR